MQPSDMFWEIAMVSSPTPSASVGVATHIEDVAPEEMQPAL